MKFLERFWFGCGHCHGGDGCALADEGFDAEAFKANGLDHGLTLVVTVTLVFLLPLATAIGGAFVAGRWAGPTELSVELWQVGGAVVGFFAGVGMARVMLSFRRWLRPAGGGVE